MEDGVRSRSDGLTVITIKPSRPGIARASKLLKVLGFKELVWRKETETYLAAVTDRRLKTLTGSGVALPYIDEVTIGG